MEEKRREGVEERREGVERDIDVFYRRRRRRKRRRGVSVMKLANVVF
jgi:hypothetical protein